MQSSAPWHGAGHDRAGAGPARGLGGRSVAERDDNERATGRRGGWLRIAAYGLLGTAGAGVLLFAGLYLYFTAALDAEIDLVALNRVPSLTFTDEAGTIIASRGSAFGEPLTFDDIPPHLRDAFIGAEDRRFYSHFGIDLIGLTRAMWANVSAGRFVQGGSTITQQLARSLFLSNERSLTRKVEEAFIALWLEAHFSKDEILTLYLNRVYLGSGANGVDAAARRYFGLSAREVTLAQAAMLAAMTRAPARFAPTSDLDGARLRAALVLDAMIETGRLTHGEAYAARVIPAGAGTSTANIGANYFVDYAAEEVAALGIDMNQDLIVTTTIDPAIQQAAQETITQTLSGKGEDKSASQGAVVIMETTGAIRAIVGGRDYLDSPFNRATQAMRQPGSAFKPFVYLCAMEMGLTPSTIRWDEPVDIEGWKPANFGGTYAGPVTLDEAFSKSINTVAAALGQEVGIGNVVAAAARLGLRQPVEANRSLPLGTSEVTLVDLAGAYLPFANLGRSEQRHVVLAVKTPAGDELYRYVPPVSEQVIAERVAREMNYLMADVVRFGTGRRAQLSGRPVAGKTGTSQDYRDALFVGYTADYLGAVWIGNDDNQPMDKVVGGNLPAEIWARIMATAHAGRTAKPLPGADDYYDRYQVAREPWQERYPNAPQTEYPPYTPPPQGRRYDERDLGEAILDWLFGPPPPRPYGPPPGRY
ncbi:MAG: PBP1A family penicillin-binding protein [Alphaproteobacteria bacterium]|nr:PBP1A family penicillin-binding protein [Alphaproteobacteria bacterium]